MEYIRKQFYTLKERILEPRKFMQVLADSTAVPDPSVPRPNQK